MSPMDIVAAHTQNVINYSRALAHGELTPERYAAQIQSSMRTAVAMIDAETWSDATDYEVEFIDLGALAADDAYAAQADADAVRRHIAPRALARA